MKKIIINENQKGFLFKDGKYVKMLSAGKYTVFGGRKIEIVSLNEAIISNNCSLDTLLADEAVAKCVEVVEVEDQKIALHYVNGKFESVLSRGKYAFWNIVDKHTFNIVDISTTIVDDSIPTYILNSLSSDYCLKTEINEYQKGIVYINKKLVKVLDAGTYYFWKNSSRVEVTLIDTRLTQMNIIGQEMLSADKVSVRINFICNYRVSDYVKIITEINDFNEQLHVAAQLALREYVAKHKFDEILENREEISNFVFERLKSKESELFVEFSDAGVKDIILPGEIRDIMNTVLIAEKRAQANVITRREEVASTRSLLNTAKLMDENQTLYKLKELEYVERICENVGNINLNGNGDFLAQLTTLLSSKKA